MKKIKAGTKTTKAERESQEEKLQRQAKDAEFEERLNELLKRPNDPMPGKGGKKWK